MKVLVVLSLELDQDADPQQIVEAVKAIDPENVPHFSGQMRIVVEPYSSQVVDWLDEELEEEEGAPSLAEIRQSAPQTVDRDRRPDARSN
jgi:hypothetical protein